MALRSGYKGIKKLAAGLKWNRPGILGVKTYAGSPIQVNEYGIGINVTNGIAYSIDPQSNVASLTLDQIFEKISGTGTNLLVNANSFSNISVTIPSGYTVLNARISMTGEGASANSFASLVTWTEPGKFVVGNKDTAPHTWAYEYDIILIKNEFVKNYTSRSLATSPEEEPAEVIEEKTATKKTTTKKKVKDGE